MSQSFILVSVIGAGKFRKERPICASTVKLTTIILHVTAKEFSYNWDDSKEMRDKITLIVQESHLGRSVFMKLLCRPLRSNRNLTKNMWILLGMRSKIKGHVHHPERKCKKNLQKFDS